MSTLSRLLFVLAVLFWGSGLPFSSMNAQAQWMSGPNGISYSGGSVGIGTSSPTHTLHVDGTLGVHVENASNLASEYPTASSYGDVQFFVAARNNGIEIGNSKNINDRRSWILARHNSAPAYGKYYSTLHIQPDVGTKSQYRGVAIGYDAGTHLWQTHLAVNGRVGVREIVVTQSNWADHVFAEGYDLMPLGTLDAFIQTHGHLPGVPTADEVAENGAAVGATQVMLLEKVEELTLHTIAQQKQIAHRDAHIESLEARLGALLNRVEKLESDPASHP